MFRQVVSSLILGAFLTSPAIAQLETGSDLYQDPQASSYTNDSGWTAASRRHQRALNSTADNGDQTHDTRDGTKTNSDYQHENVPGDMELAPQGWADTTNTQGPGTPNGPNLTGTNSGSFLGNFISNSGAVTSAPYSFGSAGGALAGSQFVAPGNLALKQMPKRKLFSIPFPGANPIAVQLDRLTLPPTRLESFVRNSGFNDLIYGDEGENGVPPYEVFDETHRIERGINMPDLTTGHPSDAPAAWGWPN